MLSRFQQFSFVISEINRHIQKIERDEMIKYGCKGAFAQYLVVLLSHPDGLTAARLCELCDKDKAAVSRIVTEMQEKGLVSRSSENARAYNALIVLTEDGRKAAEHVCLKARAAVKAVGSELSDDDRLVLYSVLDIIASKLQKLSEEGIPEEA